MDHLELLRETLYKLIENGDNDSILRKSQELDEQIVFYMKKQLSLKAKSA